MEERIINPEKLELDLEIETNLRPRILKDYIGQGIAKEKIDIFIKAARLRGESLDHVLLYGPPGLGKTTLANIIANEMGVNITITSGPAIQKAGDLAAILTNLDTNDVLFIDEIHRINKSVEEILYPALEDYELDFMVGKGPSAKSIRLELKKFTLIGATTRVGMLTTPFRDRFGVISRLEYYTDEELYQIVIRSASILRIAIDEEGATQIARRSRGTPRIANRLLKRVRDYAQIRGNGKIDSKTADEALLLFEVDKRGLDNIDKKLLETIIHSFAGGPVGLDTLAASIGEDSGTIEDVYEPYLLQIGFLSRTPRGRIALNAAYEHLNIDRERG